MRIHNNDLLTLTETILRKSYDYSAKEAAITAYVLAEADARNIPSRGVSRLDFYRKNIRGGFTKPGAEPEIVHQTPSSLVVDGHDGVGSYVADWSVAKLLERAERTGVAFCAVRNSNHFGIAGLWAEKIAQHDMLGTTFTNTRPCAIPTFRRERVLGTNPIAAAIPEADGRIFLLDTATTVAHGKVEVYGRRKKPMPQGWAVDERGAGTTDATAFERLFSADPRYGGHLFLGGEGEESGGHKGFGLGLLVELLCFGMRACTRFRKGADPALRTSSVRFRSTFSARRRRLRRTLPTYGAAKRRRDRGAFISTAKKKRRRGKSR